MSTLQSHLVMINTTDPMYTTADLIPSIKSIKSCFILINQKYYQYKLTSFTQKEFRTEVVHGHLMCHNKLVRKSSSVRICSLFAPEILHLQLPF